MSRPAIIITGGARRVGAAMARYFARHGYDIALHYHRSEQDAKALKTEVEALGASCMLFPHDLSDIAGIPRLMARIHAAMPQARTLVNNASVFERAGFMETDEALFDRQFAVNLKAPFFLTQVFARVFSEGCVVNVVDSNITQSHGSHFAYLLSKKSLGDFTAMAARALGPAIRVNGVCPGIILPSNELDEEYMKALAKRLPLKRVAQLDEVAEAVRLLCESQATTGQLLFVDGGEHVG